MSYKREQNEKKKTSKLLFKISFTLAQFGLQALELYFKRAQAAIYFIFNSIFLFTAAMATENTTRSAQIL